MYFQDSDKDDFYSIALTDGRVEVRLRSETEEISLLSNSTYSQDEKFHTIMIMKEKKQ